MRTPDHLNPLGNAYQKNSRVAVVGTAGTDYLSTSTEPLDTLVRPDQKRTVGDWNEYSRNIRDYGIVYGKPFPGMTPGNFAVGLARLSPFRNTVYLNTTLAPDDFDPSSITLRERFADVGIRVVSTPTQNIHNPVSAVLPDYAARRIYSFKDMKTGAIDVTPNGIRPSLTVLCNAAGDWVGSWINGIEYAEQTDSQLGIVASESQIAQLGDNPRKLDIYMRALKRSIFFSGNKEEAQMLADFGGWNVDQNDPVALARYLQSLGQDKVFVQVTNGREGGVTADWHYRILEHTVPQGPISDNPEVTVFGRVRPSLGTRTNTLGAGDGGSAGMVGAVRLRGANPDAIEWAVSQAALNSSSVVGEPDAQSGQYTLLEFDRTPHPAIEIKVYEAPKWV